MIILRPYRVSDWSQIKDAIEPFSTTKKFLQTTKNGVAVTATEDGYVMACGGIIYHDNDNGIAWAKVSRGCLKHPVKWGMAIRKTFKMMTDTVGDLVISTYVLKDFCHGDRVARLIGLRRTDETEVQNGNIYIKYTVK